MKNDIAKIKNTLEGINKRLEQAEDQNNELQDKKGKNLRVSEGKHKKN